MVHTVHNSVKGRVRLKVEGLYRTDPLRIKIEEALSLHPGITGFSANVLTGSVIVNFNSGNTAEIISRVIEAAVKEYNGNNHTPESTSLTTKTRQPDLHRSLDQQEVILSQTGNSIRAVARSARASSMLKTSLRCNGI